MGSWDVMADLVADLYAEGNNATRKTDSAKITSTMWIDKMACDSLKIKVSVQSTRYNLYLIF